jgi:hypothetical protein
MIIRRGTRPRRFTIVDLALMNDARLSAEALGVLIYLLSKPDDWTVSVEQLKRRFNVGRDKMQSIMRLLRDCGYARLEQLKEPGTGRLIGQGYLIHDEAVVAPAAAAEEHLVPAAEPAAIDCDREPENPALGEEPTENRLSRLPETPTVGKPGAIYNTESEPKTEREPTPQPPASAGGEGGASLWDQFATGWAWDDLDIPDQARRAFERLDTVDQNYASRYAASFCAKAKARDRKIPSARTWLTNRGWENLAKASRSTTASTPQVPIWAGSSQAIAWAKHEGKWDEKTKKSRIFMFEIRHPDGRFTLGTYRPSEWPPAKAQASSPATTAQEARL